MTQMFRVLINMILFNHITSLLSNHDRRSICVTRWDSRHDTGIHYSQITNSVNSQSNIHNSFRVGHWPHFSSAHWVVDRLRVVPCHAPPKFIREPLQVSTSRYSVRIQSGIKVPHYCCTLGHLVTELGTLNLEEFRINYKVKIFMFLFTLTKTSKS